ncbi:hypothetical protein C7S13_8768 [Burkholderia cepacia]|nr:hypothetical protein [Burkholderia cepacia]
MLLSAGGGQLYDAGRLIYRFISLGRTGSEEQNACCRNSTASRVERCAVAKGRYRPRLNTHDFRLHADIAGPSAENKGVR